MPTFSILLLAHQNAWSIEAALQSIIAQSFQDWECNVCDDASSDGTWDIVQPFLNDPRIKYVRHSTNLRQANNWAFAIQHSACQYLATLHADDVWESNALTEYLRSFQECPDCDLVICRYERCNRNLERMAHQPRSQESARLSGESAFEFLLKTNSALPSATAFTREASIRAGQPFAKYGMLCDRDYFLRLAKVSRRVAVVNQSITKYRVHDSSVTNIHSCNGALIDELIDFDERLKLLIQGHPNGDRLLSEYQSGIAEFYFRSAMTLRIKGKFERAETLLQRAFEFDPRIHLDPKRFIKFLMFRSGGIGNWALGLIHGRNTFVNS